MPEDTRTTDELKEELDRLNGEVERYRRATEDALQQLDWCIGYFTGAKQSSLAKALSANRSYIRKHLMEQAELPSPTGSTQQDQSR